ncbi:MAG: D-2-hydroxyacid dehydrogenase [Acidobacteria bacterium]|nr:D-2-hydroxyacid dehydrogenase [Acidobacteriota bacterium]
MVILESAANVREIAAGVEVIFNWSGSRSLIREVFLTCRNLRWIHSRSAGLERILFPELIASYVTVTNGRGVFSPALGEFVLAAILYFAKDLRRMIISQMANSWCPFEVTMVAGQTLGIVGYGDIGHAIAARARALGMQVLALKRKPLPRTAPNQFADQIYGSDERLAMLPRCDYIVVATPLNGETHGMIGEAEFASMKRSAVVINVGRGPVIDEPAMVKALSEHRIRGAALDVFDEEPLPSGHPFYQLENVLLSPHCADHTPGWLDDAMRFFLAQLARFRRGETLLNVVDKALGY